MIQDLEILYKASQKFAKSHYENFPVISLTLPSAIKKHISILYQFARQADDIADEGDISPVKRIEMLEKYSNQLKRCIDGNNCKDFWKALKNTIDEKRLDPEYFFDLLSAFKQDVTKTRYEDYAVLKDYCRRSANPVGRLMLQLFGIRDERALCYADSICTALQLTNFYQDISIDYKKDRIYLPQDEMEKFHVNENIFEKKQNNTKFKELMRFQVKRTIELFSDGRNLIEYLPMSFLIQMKMTILGGEKILQKIEELDFDVLNSRPKLTKLDYFGIFVKGIVSNGR